MVIDLFSGIGGFSLAAHAVGFETVAFCEIEPYPQSVLRRHFQGVPIFDDVKELTADALADSERDDAERWGKPGVVACASCQAQRGERAVVRDTTRDCGENDSGGILGVLTKPCEEPLILTAGFPCQDISYAGKGAGLDGERSGLFYEVARLVSELGPDYVLLENVAALLTRGLDAVLGTLASLGYDALWACIPACAVGAPHRRDRVWILAIPQSPDSKQRLEAIYSHVLSRLTSFVDLRDGWPTATASDAWSGDMDRAGIVGKHNLGLGTAVRLGYATEEVVEKTTSGLLNPDWVETLMGYPVGYTLPDGEPLVTLPGVWPVGLGAPQHEWEPPRLTNEKEHRTARLKALGNSIVPQVALLWMEAIQVDRCNTRSRRL